MLTKKGAILVPLVVIFTFITLLSAFMVLSHKYDDVKKANGEDRYVGKMQSMIFEAYQKIENARFYLSQSAKLSAYKAVKSLAEKGSGCGDYFGFSIWTTKDNECYPTKDNIQDRFKTQFNNELNFFSSKYIDVAINTDDFDFKIQEGDLMNILGISKQDVSVPLFASNIFSGDVKTSQLEWPVNGPVSSCFGNRDITGRTNDWHDAIDVAVQTGTDVLAAADGVVEKICTEWVGECACTVGPQPNEEGACPGKPGTCEKNGKERSTCCGKCGNYGNYIIIKHSDTFYTRYDHLSEVDIEQGDNVKKGKVIGKAGNTGLSFGSHLDFKVYLSGDTSKDKGANPLCYLSSPPGYTSDAYSCKDSQGNIKTLSCSTDSTDLSKSSEQLRVIPSNVYSFNLNFKTQIKYNLNEYELLQSSIANIVKETGNCQENKEICLNTALSNNKAFEWEVNCGTDEQKIMSGILETMFLCKQSGYEGYCTYDIPQTKETFSFDIIHEESGIAAVSSNNKYVLQQEEPLISEKLDANNKPEFIACTKLHVEVLGEQNRVTVYLSSCPVKESRELDMFFYNGKMLFYNKPKDKSFVSFLNPKVFDEKKLTKINVVKNQLKVCAKSKQTLTNTKGEKEQLIYKVSFFVGDIQPPDPVDGINVINTPKTEKNVTVSFNANKEPDIAYYDVFYSAEAYTNINSATLLTESVSGINPVIKLTEENPIKNDGSGTYSKTFRVPEDEKTYYFSVVAVDTSGNVNREVSAVSGYSKDELNPGSIENEPTYAKVTSAAPTINVLIKPPAINTDGSSLDDLTYYRLYLKEIKDINQNTCSVNDISSTISQPTEVSEPLTFETANSENKVQFTLPDDASLKKYCLVVIAEDDNTADDDTITTERYSMNSIVFVKI